MYIHDDLLNFDMLEVENSPHTHNLVNTFKVTPYSLVTGEFCLVVRSHEHRILCIYGHYIILMNYYIVFYIMNYMYILMDSLTGICFTKVKIDRTREDVILHLL